MKNFLLFSLPLFACGYPPNDPANLDPTTGTSSGLGFSSTGMSFDPVMTTTDTTLMDSSSQGSFGGSSGTSSWGSSTTLDESSTGSSTGPVELCVNPDDCRLVFVSSSFVLPNLGEEGFHKKCQELATAAGHPGIFKALIMTEKGFWKDFQNYQGQYVLYSGTLVADPGGLKSLVSPILENEKGEVVPPKSAIWTGFSAEYLLDFTCNIGQMLWADNLKENMGVVGLAGGAGSSWYDEGQAPCHSSLQIYCFETGE